MILVIILSTVVICGLIVSSFLLCTSILFKEIKKTRRKIMDAINNAVNDLEATQAQVLSKIAELKANGTDQAALQTLATRIGAVNQALKDAIV